MKNLQSQTTILLIENNSDWLVETCLVLQEAGYVVLIASAGHEGLYLAKRERPDLIVCENFLPDCSGIELCGKIRADEELQHTPFVLIGEVLDADGDAAVEAFRAGADDYFDENCNPQFVEAKVTRLIELKRSETELRQNYQRLHRSETHLAKLLEDTSNLITVLDPTFRFVVFDEYQEAESVRAFDKKVEIEKQQANELLRVRKRNADALNNWKRALQVSKSADIYEFGGEPRERVYYDVA